MNSILFVIASILAVYLLLCVLLYFIQEYFIFHPEILPDNFVYEFSYPFEEVNIQAGNGAVLNGIHFKLPQSKGVVYYFKGNTRSVKGWSKFAKDFISKGYDFFVMDYRGFGKSKGKRNERLMYKDALLGYRYLKKQYPENQIVIYGRSIGSGFATYTASKTKPKMLILDSPYLSFRYIARRYAPIFPHSLILKYHIRTDRYIRQVPCNVYILHGTKDWLIPLKHASLLASRNKHVNLIRIDKAGHNNLPQYPQYHLALYDILHENYKRVSLYEEVY